MSCAITVASAAPSTPIPKPNMNRKSSPTFSTAEITSIISGTMLSPKARRMFASRLYISVTISPPATIVRYSFACSKISAGVLSAVSSGSTNTIHSVMITAVMIAEYVIIPATVRRTLFISFAP